MHAIKILDKHGLVALAVPFVGMSLAMSNLPIKIVWALLIGSSGYLLIKTLCLFGGIGKSKRQKKGVRKMINTCTLTGNLGADPEVFYSSEGAPVASFNLAFKSGKDKTSWIQVKAFNKLAEITEAHLHVGARIALVGSLSQQKWETDSGEKRSSYQIIARTIEFIKTDGRGFENNTDDGTPF